MSGGEQRDGRYRSRRVVALRWRVDVLERHTAEGTESLLASGAGTTADAALSSIAAYFEQLRDHAVEDYALVAAVVRRERALMSDSDENGA